MLSRCVSPKVRVVELDVNAQDEGFVERADPAGCQERDAPCSSRGLEGSWQQDDSASGLGSALLQVDVGLV